MVRSLAAKELAITELGERLCALNIVSGRRGLGEEEVEPRGAHRWTDGKIDGARFDPPFPPPSRPSTGHVTWGTATSLSLCLSSQHPCQDFQGDLERTDEANHRL